MIEFRPWGWMLKFIHTRSFWLKLLWVRGRTSLQTHKNRSEWHIGICKIPAGTVHRMQHGLFIELAFGKPDENDIDRLEDDYGRKAGDSNL